MRDLAIDALIDFPRDAVDHALGRHDLDGHVGQHEFDRLMAADRGSELNAPPGPIVGKLERADRGTETIGGDLQPRLDEPVLGELEPLADAAQHAVGADFHAFEQELRMTKHIRVGEFRLALDRKAGCVAIDEEERRHRGIAVDERMHDDVVGFVAARDEPLFAVDDVAVAAASRRRL